MANAANKPYFVHNNRYHDEHNQKVVKYLRDQLQSEYSGKYSDTQVNSKQYIIKLNNSKQYNYFYNYFMAGLHAGLIFSLNYNNLLANFFRMYSQIL